MKAGVLKSGAAAAGPVKILVVDDQPYNLVALEATLADRDHEVICASSGKEALRRLLQDDYAVVLLDVMMPEVDGFEVAALMRQRDRTRHTPIIFLSATGTDESFALRGYQVGAVDYLRKPSVPEVVRAKVGVFVELYRKERQVRAQAEELRQSERRRKDLELAELRRASERRYLRLIESIPQIVFTADAEGNVLSFNQRFRELTGCMVAEQLGKRWLELLHPGERESFTQAWLKAVREERPFEAECRLKQANGSHRWQLVRARPEPKAHHDAGAWLGTFTDIEDRKREEERAREGIRQRDEFILIASHELNTPLTSLRLQLQRLERAVQHGRSEGIAESVAVADRSARRLGNLVQMLLDASRITAGRLDLQRERTELRQLVADVVERMNAEAARAGSALSFSGGGEMWAMVDRGRIDQVVTNLLSNAIKYGNKQPVTVTLDDDHGRARIRVRDHGIGIAPEQRHRIFQRFARAVSERNYGGLGLGLFIVAQIIAAHGGEVEVESEPGNGSTFTVWLPSAK